MRVMLLPAELLGPTRCPTQARLHARRGVPTGEELDARTGTGPDPEPHRPADGVAAPARDRDSLRRRRLVEVHRSDVAPPLRPDWVWTMVPLSDRRDADRRRTALARPSAGDGRHRDARLHDGR